MENITQIEVVENMLKIGDYLKMFRINYNGLRLYLQQEPFAYYSGLTGALAAATFKGDPEYKRIKSWREGFVDNFGLKNANDYLEMTADFGTLLHTAAVTIKENGSINWNEEKDKAFNYFVQAYREKLLEPDLKVIKKMTYEYQKHVASLLQFCHERVQEIYAIETPAKWEELRIATPIDMFCKCKQTDKGEFFDTTINIKTSSQISKGHLEQIACEMMMWNETYEKKAFYTAIMRTKDWTEGKTPTYEYKYMDGVTALDMFVKTSQRLKLCLNSEASYFPEPTNKSFTGITNLGEQPIITIKSLQEEWEEVNQSNTLIQ